MDKACLTRRAVAGAGLALIGGAALAAEPAHDITADADFDELWTTLRDRYCFFGEKRTDWNRVRAFYRPMAIAAPDEAAFTEVVEYVLAELYDAHTHLSSPPDGARRWPPYDLLVERAGEAARVVAVKDASAAAHAGLAIGDDILAVGGRPVGRVAVELAPKCLSRPDPAAEAYALNTAVAGRRAEPRTLTVRSAGQAPREVLLPLNSATQRPNFESRRLEGGFGYIAIRSFGEAETVAAFDKALAELRDAPGLIIDVRDNGGGDTAVARPIMGRFVTATRPYAIMRRRQGQGLSAPWTEPVDPTGPFTYDRPVVVLTNGWSGSMAEGFPMGMRGIGRARVVGTRMMGLGAAVLAIRLDRTGIAAQYSGEPVYDVHGQPRWLMRPDVEVPPGADILAAGIAELGRLTSNS